MAVQKNSGNLLKEPRMLFYKISWKKKLFFFFTYLFLFYFGGWGRYDDLNSKFSIRQLMNLYVKICDEVLER